MKYINASNPAAFAVEWVAESGNRFQLVNSRGTASLMFGAYKADEGRWVSTPVVDPARFGLTAPCKTFSAFMNVVRAYVEE